MTLVLKSFGKTFRAMWYYKGASINRGPQNSPKYTMILVIGTTKMGPLISGNIHNRKWTIDKALGPGVGAPRPGKGLS